MIKGRQQTRDELHHTSKPFCTHPIASSEGIPCRGKSRESEGPILNNVLIRRQDLAGQDGSVVSAGEFSVICFLLISVIRMSWTGEGGGIASWVGGISNQFVKGETLIKIEGVRGKLVGRKRKPGAGEDGAEAASPKPDSHQCRK